MGLKKKLSKFKLSTKMIKILKKEKVKLKNGTKVSLKPFIDKTAEGTVVAREGAVPSQQTIIVPGSPDDMNSLTTAYHAASMIDFYREKVCPIEDHYTFVIMVNQKSCEKLFDFMADTFIGELLRTSTLGRCYKDIKAKWELLFQKNDDDEPLSNVLYLPDIYAFLGRNGKALERPFYFNLLLVAVPSKKEYQEEQTMGGEGIISDSTLLEKMIRMTLQTAVQLRCKQLIIDPLYDAIRKIHDDPHMAATQWKLAMELDEVPKQIYTIDFCIPDDDERIIFKSGSDTDTTDNASSFIL